MPQPQRRPGILVLGEGLFANELTAAFSRAGASVPAEEGRADIVVRAPPVGPVPQPFAEVAIPSAELRALTGDREKMRRLATEELEFPTSRYAVAASVTRLKSVVDMAIGYPCIVKPRQVSGPPPVVVAGPMEVESGWAALSWGGRDGVVVESHIDNALDLILPAVGQRAGPPQFGQPIGLQRGERTELWQPHLVPPVALVRAQRMASDLITRLALTGVVGVRFLIKGPDIWFNRFTLGPDALTLITLVSQVQSVFDLHARALLGVPLDTSLRQAGAGAMICGRREVPAAAEGGPVAALRFGYTLEGDCTGMVLAGAKALAEALRLVRRAF